MTSRPCVRAHDRFPPIAWQLWHWPILTIFRHTCGLRSAAHHLSAAAAFVGGALVSYHLLELPIRRWSPRRHAFVYVSMLGAIALCELWLLVLWGPLSGQLLLSQGTPRGLSRLNISATCPVAPCANSTVLAGPDPDGPFPLRGRVAATGALTCGCTSTPSPSLYVAVGQAPSNAPPACYLCQAMGCQGETRRTKQEMSLTRMPGDMSQVWTHPCTYTTPAAGRTAEAVTDECLTPLRGGGRPSRALFLMGDSHAGHLVPGLTAALAGAASLAWAVRLGEYVPMAGWWTDRAMANLEANLQAGDVVMWSQSLALYAKLRIRHSSESAGVAARFLARLHGLVRARGASLVLVGDGPYFPSCNTDGWKGSEQLCQTTWHSGGAQSNALMSAVYGGANLTQGSLPGVFVFDVPSHVCAADGTCSNLVPGPHEPGTAMDVVAFYDSDHFTLAGSLFLWPHFCRFFQANGLLPGSGEQDEASGPSLVLG